MAYGYAKLMSDINRFRNMGVEVGVIGLSFGQREIPYVFLGRHGGNEVLIQGGIHGRESITSQLVVGQIEFLLNKLSSINGGIYFVPMVNVDGVELCNDGLASVSDPFTRRFLSSVNGFDEDFSLWKANQNAVDLNVNFDARWGTGAQNVFVPAPQNYVGEYPVSELESKALCRITMERDIKGTISYHAKGNIIFWDFYQEGYQLVRDRKIANVLSSLTTYPLVPSGDSAGGFKDWCIESLKIPAYTFEIGSPEKSYLQLFDEYDIIFQKNKDVPVVFLNEINLVF